MWCLQWYVGYENTREGRTLTLIIEKVDQSNPTIKVWYLTSGEGWVLQCEKREHDSEKPKQSKTKLGLTNCDASISMHLTFPSWAKSSKC